MSVVPDPSAFPVLRAFLRGYLNQDFPELYGGVREAVLAFGDEASSEELDAVGAEARRLAALFRELPLAAARRFLADDLGSAYVPRRRRELEALLAAVAALAPLD